MRLVRKFVLITLKYNILFRALHIAGVDNRLSRQQGDILEENTMGQSGSIQTSRGTTAYLDTVSETLLGLIVTKNLQQGLASVQRFCQNR